MSKKAQLSMETIMIYGAVILVVTLAIGALIYFGVLDLGAMLPDKCDSGGKITCENFVVDTTNGVKLEFINRVGKNIDVTAIKITGLDDWTGTDSTGSYTGSGISNGERFLADALAVTLTGKKGRYKGRIQITYNIVGSTLAQKVTGEINAKIAQG